ncbi:unnamed protein product [Amoebophrya sp. A25]|nr:unnamed protein product [Amoebophrya sp. A25]|eukprot:GSA25T00024477001.1
MTEQLRSSAAQARDWLVGPESRQPMMNLDLESGTSNSSTSLRESLSTLSTSLRERVSGEEENEVLEACCPRLSYKQRLTGWAACFAAGTLLSLAASRQFKRDPGHFARLYTLGNLVSLSASFFLMGPAAQLKRLLDQTRRWTVLVLLILFVATIMSSVFIDQDSEEPTLKNRVVILLLVCAQYAAMLWYTLSYIPYGRSVVRSCLTRCFKGVCC